MRLFGQMLLLPFTVFVFGIELFARTVRELQRTADEGNEFVGGEAATFRRISSKREQSSQFSSQRKCSTGHLSR